MTAPRAYYSEWDKHAAAWLRELIKRGLIAHGDVDERSITDVRADDLRGYDRLHFFAGIGTWDYALTLAGWPDGVKVASASLPCQPFSVAGRAGTVTDERHLWPVMFRLIRELGIDYWIGEQVGGRNGYAFLDHVANDMESIGYAVGAICAPACGFGAPHKRERLYWCAHLECTGQPGSWPCREQVHPAENPFGEADGILNAVQGRTLPWVCMRHDGIAPSMAGMHALGNAIVAPQAAEFILAFIDVAGGGHV